MNLKNIINLREQTTRTKNGCWVWNHGKHCAGYGQVRWHGKPMLTHRLAMLLSGHSLTPELFVCHKCDNPPCCNPEHLFLGDAKDNTLDRMSKNRQPSILTERQKHTIRRLYHSGKNNIVSLSLKYKVSRGLISGIVSNKIWKIPGEPEYNFRIKLTDDEVRELRDKWLSGSYTQKNLAKEYGISTRQVSSIVNRKSRSNVQ